MRKKLLLLTVFALAAALFLPGIALAATLYDLDDFASPSVRGADPYEQGTYFTVGDDPVDVSALGFIDVGVDGLDDDHTVSLWLASDSSLVDSVVVTTTDTEEGGFRWAEFAGGNITLAANTQYVISADTSGSDGWYDYQAVPFSTDIIGDSTSDECGLGWGAIGTMPGIGWTGFETYGLVNIMAPTTAVTNPNPADGETVVASLTTLSWTNPAAEGTLSHVVTLHDPNIALDATGTTLTTPTADTATVSLTLGHTYEWSVVVTDSGTGVPTTSVWSFNTVNSEPEVDAGYDQAVWLSGGTATAEMAATVTDDVLPEGASYTLAWSGADFGSTGAEEDATATFTSVGTYVLTLTADDTALVGSDSVTVYVYAEGDDQLVANWELTADMNDSVGTNHGTASGAGAAIDSGSLLLDGADYVDCGDGIVDANFMTVSCWVNTTSTTAWAGLVGKGDAWTLETNGNGDDVWFRINSEATTNGEEAGASSGNVPEPGDKQALMSMADGEWNYIVAVNTGDSLAVYINGILAEQNAHDVSIAGEENVMIGKSVYESLDPVYETNFTGRIKDVKLYAAPLSLDMIIAEYVDGGGSDSCGGDYVASDINKDCYTDIDDIVELAGAWLTCSDVADYYAECD